MHWMPLSAMNTRLLPLYAHPMALRSCLTSMVVIRLPQALQEAKETLDVHMDQVAEQTFAASMVLAGIEAAKEVGFPRDQAAQS